MHKPHEIFPSLRRTFVYSGIFQYMDECIPHFLLQDIHDIFLCNPVIIRKEPLDPLCMLFNLLIASDILAFHKISGQYLQFFLQPGRQDCKAHHLDKADIFLLDIVVLRMRMIHA